MKTIVPIVNFLTEKDTNHRVLCLGISLMMLEVEVEKSSTIRKTIQSHFFTNPMTPSKFFPFMRMQSPQMEEVSFLDAYNKKLMVVFRSNFVLTASKDKVLSSLAFYYRMFSNLKKNQIEDILLKLSQQVIEVPVKSTNILDSLNFIKLQSLQIRDKIKNGEISFIVNRDGKVVEAVVENQCYRLPSTAIVEYLPQVLERETTLYVAPPIDKEQRREQKKEQEEEKERKQIKEETKQKTEQAEQETEVRKQEGEKSRKFTEENTAEEGKVEKKETEKTEKKTEEAVVIGEESLEVLDDETIAKEMAVAESEFYTLHNDDDLIENDDDRYRYSLNNVINETKRKLTEEITESEERGDDEEEVIKQSFLAGSKRKLTDDTIDDNDTPRDFLGNRKQLVDEQQRKSESYDNLARSFLSSLLEVMAFYNEIEVIKYIKVSSALEIDFFKFLTQNTTNISSYKILPYYSFLLKLKEEKGFLPIGLSENNFPIFAKEYLSLTERVLETIGARDKLAALVYIAERIFDTYPAFNKKVGWFVSEIKSYKKKVRRELSRIRIILSKLFFIPQKNTISDIIDERLSETFPNNLLHGDEVFALTIPSSLTESIISYFSILEWEEEMNKTKNCVKTYLTAVKKTAERGGFDVNEDEFKKFLETFEEKAGSFLDSVVMPYEFISR